MQLLKLWIGNFMLSRFKKNSTFKHHIFLLIMLFTKLYSQEISNQYNLELNPNLSNQWWSHYNNYGQELSEIQFNYKTSYTHKKADFNLNVFASKNRIYIHILNVTFAYTLFKIFHYSDILRSMSSDIGTPAAPIHVRIKPINLCNNHCWYCAYKAKDMQLGEDMD